MTLYFNFAHQGFCPKLLHFTEKDKLSHIKLTNLQHFSSILLPSGGEQHVVLQVGTLQEGILQARH